MVPCRVTERHQLQLHARVCETGTASGPAKPSPFRFMEGYHLHARTLRRGYLRMRMSTDCASQRMRRSLDTRFLPYVCGVTTYSNLELHSWSM